MAPKAHRTGATGLPRTHSRSSSSGSSKAALNLHFTQKDPTLERTKRAGHGHEVCPLIFFSTVLSDLFFSLSHPSPAHETRRHFHE